MSLGSDFKIELTNFSCSPFLRSCAPYGFLALHIEASACYVWCSRQRRCRNGVSDLRKLQTWLYELADPQFTAVYAESQDEKREITTLLKR